MRLKLANGRRTIVEQIGEKCLKAFWPKQTISHCVDHDCLRRLIANTDFGARGFPAAQPARQR